MTNLLFNRLTAIGKRFAMVLTMLLIVGIGQVWGYTITFSTGNNTGTKATTSTTCASLVSEGSDYLTGNLQTATNVYPTTSNNLRIGNSSAAGTLKMNLSNNGKVNATTIIVKAKQYTSDKGKTLKVNGSQAQTPANNWGDLTFTINADITYIELVASGYLYVQSITINTNGGESGDNDNSDICDRWVETNIGDIADTDDVIVTMHHETSIYALNSSKGTSAAPPATPITAEQLATKNWTASDLLWNIEKEAEKLIFHPKGTTKNLYCNASSSNDRVRIGTSGNATTNHQFAIDGDYLKFSRVIDNTTKTYYIGVYTSGSSPDWRGYTSSSTNIANQTLKFYKYVECGSTESTHYLLRK